MAKYNSNGLTYTTTPSTTTNFYDDSSYNASTITAVSIWMIIALVLAVVGGILVYFPFVKAKKNRRVNLLSGSKISSHLRLCGSRPLLRFSTMHLLFSLYFPPSLFYRWAVQDS